MVTTPQAKIEAAAAQLFEAARTGQPCEPVRTLLAEGDVEGAYAAQTINTTRALPSRPQAGGPQDRPHLAGGAEAARRASARLRHAVRRHGARRWRGHFRPRCDAAEGGGGDRLRDRPRPRRGAASPSPISIAPSSIALPAIEIVGSRIANWKIRHHSTPSPTTPHPAFTCLAPVLAASTASICALPAW